MDGRAGEVRIRAREEADLPVLADVLWAQQAESHYPVRNPLPMPVEEFLHAHDAERAWVAEVGGRVVGNVCRLAARSGFPDADELNTAGATAHGCAVEDLAWVSTLFVDRELRGRGVGRLLLQTVTDDVRRHQLRPCLEVLPVNAGAHALYRAAGWRTVHTLRPAWLREARGDEGPDVEVMVLTERTEP